MKKIFYSIVAFILCVQGINAIPVVVSRHAETMPNLSIIFNKTELLKQLDAINNKHELTLLLSSLLKMALYIMQRWSGELSIDESDTDFITAFERTYFTQNLQGFMGIILGHVQEVTSWDKHQATIEEDVLFRLFETLEKIVGSPDTKSVQQQLNNAFCHVIAGIQQTPCMFAHATTTTKLSHALLEKVAKDELIEALENSLQHYVAGMLSSMAITQYYRQLAGMIAENAAMLSRHYYDKSQIEKQVTLLYGLACDIGACLEEIDSATDSTYKRRLKVVINNFIDMLAYINPTIAKKNQQNITSSLRYLAAMQGIDAWFTYDDIITKNNELGVYYSIELNNHDVQRDDVLGEVL